MKTQRSHFTYFLAAFALYFLPGFLPYASAKLTGPVTAYFTQNPVEAVLLAELGDRDRHELVITKVYFGDMNAGDTMAINPEAYSRQFDLSWKGQRLAQKQTFVLFLSRSLPGPAGDHRVITDGLLADSMMCRRIIDGKVYAWMTNRHEDIQAPEGILMELKDLKGLPDVENKIRTGLADRARWIKALASQNLDRRLELLRPFLVPADESFFTHYEVWAMSYPVLKEVEKTGAHAIPFLESLLALPEYAPDYTPKRWPGYGIQQRCRLQQVLQLQIARTTDPPAKKLAALRPLFTIQDYQTTAGIDSEFLVDDVMDRALVEVEKAGPQAGPFLDSLLQLPHFQADYGSRSRPAFGKKQRAKLEASRARVPQRKVVEGK